MQINDEYIVNIEKMIFGGSSFARIDNFPVFIQDGCPKDTVKIKITKLNKSYAEGEIIELIQKSDKRCNPVCSLHNACGSCDWQYIDYQEQLVQKRNIIKETLSRIANYSGEVEDTIPSPKIKEYRCKVQTPVGQTKVSKRILCGYYKKNSHELINIKYCPMQPDIINKINEFIRDKAQELNLTAYDEKKHKGMLRHIIHRISSDNTQILTILVINSDIIDRKLYELSKYVKEEFHEIVGICANFNTSKTNVILGKQTKAIAGNDYYIETLSGISYRVSANSFFQVNPLCAERIFNKVKELIIQRVTYPSILDAYAGVSSFGIWLSSIASNVVCIEEIKSASKDAEYNAQINEVKKIEIINGDAAKEFEKLIKNNIKFDVSVTDPPRKGCSEESINNLVSLTNKLIVYVSCNVSTLARDMKILNEKGFKTVFVQGVDMFPNTYHVETIALFEKIS